MLHKSILRLAKHHYLQQQLTHLFQELFIQSFSDLYQAHLPLRIAAHYQTFGTELQQLTRGLMLLSDKS